MEAPILVIVGGGFVAELFIAGAVFAAIGLVALVIAAVGASVVYFIGLREAVGDKDWVWMTNLVLAPLVGPALGYLLAIATEAPMTNPNVHFNPLLILVVLIGLYGMFVGWWHGPMMLATGEPVEGLLSYLSFASVAWAWGLIALSMNHGPNGYHWF